MTYSALGQGLLRLAGMGGRAWNAARPFASKVVGKVGIPAAVGTVVGGVRGGQQGGLGGVVPGALGGGMTGGTLGLIPGVSGLNPYLQGGLGTVGGLYGPASMGVTQRVGGLASNQLTGRGDPNSGDVLGSGNLPPGTIDRMTGPEGNYWYRLDPAGVPFGDRLNRQLDARANSNVMNILGDTGFAQTERLQKADLARQAAAKQLKENIEMARAMSEASQASGLNMA